MNTFEAGILSTYGEAGKIWLKHLPDLTQEIANSWGLTDLQPVENMSYNYVLTGLNGKRPVVLKIAFDENGLQRETRALKAFSGFGAIDVINQRPDALLLRRALPGSSLRIFFPKRDAEAIRISCALMHRLYQAPNNNQASFPTMSDWLSVLDKDWDIPFHYLEKARSLRTSLLRASSQQVLLHGDLHHDNILQDGENWVAIDPKGVMGQPVNEIWAFISNPDPSISTDIIENRIVLFAQYLGLEACLIINWCFVQSVLSWIWDIEDNLQPMTKGLTAIFDKLSR